MVKKVYVLDTNVILADVNCFYSFKTSNILIPLKVVQELDKHKKSEILGFNARTAIKFIDGLRQKGSINSGVKIGKGFGILQVAGHEDFRMPSEFPLSDPDNQILATALSQKSKIENKDKKFIVVSNDVNLRIKCDALGLECTDFKEDHVIKNRAELFTGAIELLVDDVLIDRFYRGEEVVPNVVFPENLKLFPNQFLVLISSSNEKKSALAQFVSWSLPLLKVKEGHKGDWGLVAKNKEQQFAMNLLMNPAIPLVTLVGQAGTGKTLLSLGCALEQVNFSKKGSKGVSNKSYDRILVTRPIVAMGKDIGFLPGTIQEKLSPWLGGIQDNLRTLMGNDELMLEEYSKQKIIEMEALTYIRGRSIPNSFIIIDECFPGDQLVLGENGQKYAIYDLFRDTLHNRKLPKVLSFNEETNKFEKNKILSITRKEKPRSLLELKIAGTKFNPTEEHPFLCYDKGWVKAKDLEVGDPIVSYGENKKSFKVLNEDQEQVIFGMCLGPNVKLKRTGRSKFAISSVFDKEERKEHFLKIKEILGGRIDPVIVADKIDYFEFVKNKRKHEKNEKFTSDYFYYTPEIIYKVEGYKFDYILSRIDRRGWAIFYQESVVHHEEFGPVLEVRSLYDEENYINKTINSLKNLGYDCEIVGKKFIKLKGTSFNDFASWVAPYVFECNKWLLPKKPEQFYAWKYKEADIWVSLVENKKNSKRKEFVFDLEIENNHNFIVSSPYQDNYGVVVHNCQNLTRHEVKTILTRVGEGSKIVLIGDIEQIDNVNLDETNNGLTYVIEKFKPEAIAGHTTLVKGERSILATRASKLL